MEAKVPEVKLGLDEIVVHTKAELVEAMRQSTNEYDEYDKLADLLGCNLDEDPLGFFVHVSIRYYRGAWGGSLNRDEFADRISHFMKICPNATKRAISFIPKTAEYFYEKYGAEYVCQRFMDLRSISGMKLSDLIDLDDDDDVRMIALAGNELKSKIVWAVADNWMDDLCEGPLFLTVDDILTICGDE